VSRRSLGLAIVFAALALPRVARLAFPQVWIEDDAYLNGAFLLSRGFMPYRDFPLPHFPLLEVLTAGIFTLAPASIRTAEALTAGAALTASMLVFVLARRFSLFTAVSASIVFATNSLLFRYHVFEREIFVVAPVLGAVLLAFAPHAGSGRDPSAEPMRKIVSSGALMAAAMLIKLTAIAALIALIAQLVIEHRRRAAAVLFVTALGIVAEASAVLVWLFGTDFAVQVFLFRAVHASFPSLGVKIDEMRLTLDVAFAFGVAGAVLMSWDRVWRQSILWQICAAVIFLVLLNPTYWAHTGIELLPWLSIAAGYLIARVIGLERQLPYGASSSVRPGRLPVWICAAAAVFLLVVVSPVRNLNWTAGDGSPYGFGYRDRAEISRLAAFVQSRSAEDDPVATPELIAFAANRRELVPYAELAGDIEELTDTVRREGYLAAVSRSPLRQRTFWEGVDASKERIAPVIAEAVTRGRLGSVVNYSSSDLFPIALVDVPDEALKAAGYDIGVVTSHYEGWARSEHLTSAK